MGLREVTGKSKKNRSNKLIIQLSQGQVRVFSGGKKYPGQFFYVGKSGAVKVGKTIAESHSFTKRIDIAKWRKDLEILDELDSKC